MTKIGLLSDTHAYLFENYFTFFNDCDQLWHAGDFGSMDIVERLSKFKPLIGVYGNIDGHDIRMNFPLHQRFKMEEVSVWITHIGGYPGKYEKSIKDDLFRNPPKLFISGHSHILKVMFDKKLKMLHINPGAAGKYGFHTVCTAVRFEINKDRIENLEIIELSK
ncbi:MAG: metallophosphoesterase family protein [Bacteroidales bacterium]|nr:metallophosphoesterase family protein [Bacteroidales bacterium]